MIVELAEKKERVNMTPSECPSFEGCKAPLCPEDKSFHLALWFNGEPICQAIAYRRERWRIAQRRIERTAKDKDTCYTVAMLSAIRQVRAGIMGLNPEDVIDTERVRTWIKSRQAGTQSVVLLTKKAVSQL